MSLAVSHGARGVRVEKIPDPKIANPTDALVRITHAAICGSESATGSISTMRSAGTISSMRAKKAR